MPHCVQRGMAECLGLEDGAVRVISPDVGGGFGYKGLLSREEVALAWLTRQIGEPRALARGLPRAPHRQRQLSRAPLSHHRLCRRATDGCWRSTARRHVDAGAYSVYPTSSALEAAQIASLLPGPYDFFTYRCRAAAVATNKCPILPYRGVARTGVCLAIEVVMDAIAREAGLEPYEVRLRNLVRPEQMPFENVVKKQFDGGDYPECLRRAVAAIDLPACARASSAASPTAACIGAGFRSSASRAPWARRCWPAGGARSCRATSRRRCGSRPTAMLEIRVGTHSHGQGHETTLAQIAHEVLGVEFERIKVLQGDTLYSPFSTGTWGSRSIVMAGGAVVQRLAGAGRTRQADRRMAAADRRRQRS